VSDAVEELYEALVTVDAEHADALELAKTLALQRAEAILQLRDAGESLKAIGARVNLQPTRVHQLANLARQERADLEYEKSLKRMEKDDGS
jgi:DNA-binding transcriptional MerR regulator